MRPPRPFSCSLTIQSGHHGHLQLPRLLLPVLARILTPSTILIADDASSPTLSLTPFTRLHPIALEAACTPPVKEIYFTMQVYGEYVGWDELPLEDIQRPATAWHEVAVRRSDRDGLLVADVVE